MTNKTQRINQSAQPIVRVDHDHEYELTEEAQLLAEFTQLYQQYRRAGYEYAQHMMQADLVRSMNNPAAPPEPADSEPCPVTP